MTATKTTKPGKDGSGAGYTQGMATESVASDLTPFHYLCEPVGETIITPAQDGTDGTGITPPTGATGIRGWLSGIYNKLTGTMAVSAASLPLPAGAATAAGVATVNTTLGTPMQTSGGSVTANAGTNLNTSALALEAGGNLAAIKTNTAITAAGTSATSGSGVQGMTGGVPMAVSGTFWPTTQPISAASLPLPTGAAQDGTDGTGITPPTGATGIRGWLSGIYSKVSGSIAVTGTFWQTTQPVSAASLPLPSGAATSALQTTINTTLGSPMQASGGSVTANAGTNLNTSTLAKESGGNLATVATAQGVSGTGITEPTGGSGLLGWLSGIYSTLLTILTGVTSSIPAGDALIGITGIDQTTPGTTNAVAITTPGRTPASTNSQAANTAIAASIPAVAGQYSYMSGLFIAGLGATAAGVVACNITNILASDAGSNTWHFNVTVPAGVTVALNNGLPIIINFDPPIQSKAVDTALQVNVGAFGAGNTQAVVSVWGYTSASATF